MKLKFLSKKYLIILIFFLLLSIGHENIFAQPEDDELIFRDDFTGTILNPLWKIRQEDKNRWALIENEYLLIVTASSSENKDIRNRFIYNATLPQNYKIITKINADLTCHYCDIERYWQTAQIRIERNTENYLVFSALGFNKVRFSKYTEGKRTGDIDLDTGQISGNFYLQIEKRGVEYTASYSLDGATWSRVGTQFFINLNGKLVLTVYNTRGFRETGVRIDYVEIRKTQ